MKTRRKKKKPPEPGTFVKKRKRKDTEPGTLAGTVQLSNKACPHYYHHEDPAADPRCRCPKGRCWYEEQLARRSKSFLALTPEEWRRRLDLSRPRPDFAAFVEALRAEADGTESIHVGKPHDDGTPRTDIERLRELANRVEVLGKSLGFMT